MSKVTITTDADRKGYALEVDELPGGGWIAAAPGFNGIQPGQLTKAYVNGAVHWAQRRGDRVAFLSD